MTSPISEFIFPRPALAGFLTGMVIRDTRGCALNQNQRFNFIPAEVFSIMGRAIVGDSHLIDRPDQMEHPWTGARLPTSFFLAVPRLRPLITWNPGEVYYISMGFFPDAFSAVAGIDLSSFTGPSVPPEEALPQQMLEAFRNFFDAVPREGPERSFSVLQDKIEPMWAGKRPARPTGGSPPRTIADWSRNLTLRAAQTGSGRSPRQVARRIKSWTGVTERDLEGFVRIEQLTFKWIEAARKDHLDWATLAAESGFADQAHMIRRWKKCTGLTPRQAHESFRDDEAFWYYRLVPRIMDQYLAAIPEMQSPSAGPGRMNSEIGEAAVIAPQHPRQAW